MSVTAIVPARNEAARIADTVRALRGTGLIDEVLVVDDGSRDATAACAVAAGARVVRIERTLGKGGALARGVTQTNSDILAFVDADLGDTATIAADLLAPVIAGEADMTIAAPAPSAPSGFGIVERFAAAGIKRLTGRVMRRPLSGQRALRRPLADPARIAPRFGAEVGLTIDAVRAGARVIELPLGFRHAKTERTIGGFIHRARQGADIVRALAPRVFRGGTLKE